MGIHFSYSPYKVFPLTRHSLLREGLDRFKEHNGCLCQILKVQKHSTSEIENFD